jgi:hypothetical protein
MYVRVEVFTAVTMKNDVFWDVAPCETLVRTDVSEEPILVTLIMAALSSRKRRFLQEPHGVTSQKTPFFYYIVLINCILLQVSNQYNLD